MDLKSLDNNTFPSYFLCTMQQLEKSTHHIVLFLKVMLKSNWLYTDILFWNSLQCPWQANPIVKTINIDLNDNKTIVS